MKTKICESCNATFVPKKKEKYCEECSFEIDKEIKKNLILNELKGGNQT